MIHVVICWACLRNRKMMLQSQRLLNFFLLPRRMVYSLVILVLLPTAYSNCLLKDKYGYEVNYLLLLVPFSFISLSPLFYHFVKDFGEHYRQLLLWCKICQFLGERKRLCNVHKKVSCGDLPLFLLHNLVNRFVVNFTLTVAIISLLKMQNCCHFCSEAHSLCCLFFSGGDDYV